MNTGTVIDFNISRVTPQNELAQLCVAITAHHDQRSGDVGDVRQDSVGDIDVGRRER
jgi:hypothetical protein